MILQRCLTGYRSFSATACRWAQWHHHGRAFSSTARKCIAGQHLRIDAAVEQAIKNGDPVVALESTIVAHGMPYPQNLETAQSVEDIVRSKVSSMHPKPSRYFV